MQTQGAESRASDCSETIYIPVAIHYQQAGANMNHILYQQLLAEKAKAQIALLNATFQQTALTTNFDKFKMF